MQSPNQGRFPREIYEKIIDHADYSTWKSCLIVSRLFHDHCQKTWRLNGELSLRSIHLADNEAEISSIPDVALQQKGHGIYEHCKIECRSLQNIYQAARNEETIDGQVLLPVIGSWDGTASCLPQFAMILRGLPCDDWKEDARPQASLPHETRDKQFDMLEHIHDKEVQKVLDTCKPDYKLLEQLLRGPDGPSTCQDLLAVFVTALFVPFGLFLESYCGGHHFNGMGSEPQESVFGQSHLKQSSVTFYDSNKKTACTWKRPFNTIAVSGSKNYGAYGFVQPNEIPRKS